MKTEETVHMIYHGLRLGKGKKKFHVYSIIREEENDGRKYEDANIPDSNAVWFVKELGPAPIGNICTTKQYTDEEGKRTWSHSEFNGYSGKWKNEDDRERWQAETKSINISLKNTSEATKNKYKDIDIHIEKICKAYHRLPAGQRESFLAYVLSGIMVRKMKNILGYDD